MNLKSFTHESLCHAFETMILIRRFEERASQLYGMGHIGGFCHLYIGQEAVVVGIQEAMKPQDTVITSYRDHGHMLACKMDPKGVMAELTGRIDGYSKGKGGSMHMFSIEKNFYGGHGIVGAQASLGTGMAFAHKYKKDGGVTLAYMGDGAVNQGQVYESFNMASLWNLPVVYVIEDNQYAMGTSVNRSSACGGEFFKRGEPYKIPGVKVDGMNLFDVREAAEIALEHAREKGPYILHMQTYRYRGHSMSDPAKYRTKEEVEGVKENFDPIEYVKNFILKEKILNDSDVKTIEDRVKKTVKEAADFSLESKEPDPKELYTDVLLSA
jgi:pyruvate dehydrogenase E1 component alpha subunit